MRPALILLLAALSLPACAAPASPDAPARPADLVGGWRGTMPGIRTVITVTMDFRPDGSWKQATAMRIQGTPEEVVVTGSYAVWGDTLRTTRTGVAYNGQPKRAFSSSGSVQSMGFRVEGDTMTLTTPAHTRFLTLTRVRASGMSVRTKRVIVPGRPGLPPQKPTGGTGQRHD